jgi:predicted acyl esterase
MHSNKIQTFFGALAAGLMLSAGHATLADPVPAPPAAGGDIPADFKISTQADDYVKRDVMIPMRDGV